jgi:hypothetical protein
MPTLFTNKLKEVVQNGNQNTAALEYNYSND